MSSSNAKEIPDKTFTLADLDKHRGQDGGKILISLKGLVYDVSSAREMYGPGTGYGVFAGRDVTFCFAKMSLQPRDANKMNYDALTTEENKTLDDWVTKYNEKYPVVGKLKDDGKFVYDYKAAEKAQEELREKMRSQHKREAAKEQCAVGDESGECPFPFVLLHDPIGGVTKHPGKTIAGLVAIAAYIYTRS